MIIVSDTSALSNLAVVEHLGLSIIGILGVLLIAKQRSLIPQVQPVVDALSEQAGFRISPQLYQRVLTLAKELS